MCDSELHNNLKIEITRVVIIKAEMLTMSMRFDKECFLLLNFQSCMINTFNPLDLVDRNKVKKEEKMLHEMRSICCHHYLLVKSSFLTEKKGK